MRNYKPADVSKFKIPRLSKGASGSSTSMEHNSPLSALKPYGKRRNDDVSKNRDGRFTRNRHPIRKMINGKSKPPVDDPVARTLARVVAVIKAGRRPGDSDGDSPMTSTSSSSSSSSHRHSIKSSSSGRNQQKQQNSK